ncbi:hypothetical protein LIER_34251 [Lithospermum erythrorhizon]|uniref:Uncharacterized protein n=1 Tax=Lithospermum erythrorhizon TaxID=34254 RepID=A0AAV3RZ52_LITER
MYHPHRFSHQLGFAPSIPSMRNEIRATVDVMAGPRLWRICMISRIGQRVRFPSFKESTSLSKDYLACLDNVLSCGSIFSSPRIFGSGKGLLVHPGLVLKRKASLVSISEDKDPQTCQGLIGLWKSLSSLSGGTCTEVVDTGESQEGTDEFIPPSPVVALILRDGTCPEAASAEEHPSCMASEIVDATIAAPSSIQRIESIFRDSLRVALVELCSLVEGRSHEALLAEEENILASFQALSEFSRQNLTCHGKKLKAIFSKVLRIKKVQCKAASSKIHDKFVAARASSDGLSLGVSVPSCGSHRKGPPF